MKVDRTAGARLYPDLSQFYARGAVNPAPSADLPAPRPPRRLQPTAPPMPEIQCDLHPRDLVPEEPVEDYLQEESGLRQDVAGGATHIIAGNISGCPVPDLGDLTIDYTLDDITLEDLLELEPDYDMDDLPRDTLHDLNNLNHLSATGKKSLQEKNIEVPEPPRKDQDYKAWVAWRMQANKLLAAVILARRGRQVALREWDIRRKPLTPRTVEQVVQQARGRPQGRGRKDSADSTSLPACPYVMYGIPRVNLTRPSQP